MQTRDLVLAIDQGTSSSRSVLFDRHGDIVASAQREFPQHYPASGWVEHDPEELWQSVLDTLEAVVTDEVAGRIAGIGITNQRETTLVWDRDSGRCIHRAIVWQDRRTAEQCLELKAAGHEALVTERSGLKLDPYFSASKLRWMLDHVDGARDLADAGRLAFGTVDTFLIWKLTGGRSHVTDVTNASRTALFNIHDVDWDDALLDLFDVPRTLLPSVRDCADDFGTAELPLLAGIPILGVAGDQQAALIGQAGFAEGVTKSTYGTGCFVIANTGAEARPSSNQLLTTIASRIDGQITYGLEGSVFVAGSAVQWLRDELKIIDKASETQSIAERTGVVDDVVVVPAFAGLGAPYWDPNARGAIFGLSRGSGREQIVTATLQSIALQTLDLMDAMADDGVTPAVIRVDGGMVANDWFLRFLADVLDTVVERPQRVESTVQGAGWLAAYRAGLVDSLDAVVDSWSLDQRFEPSMEAERRSALIERWRDAVSRVRVS